MRMVITIYKNPVTILLMLLIIYPILKGFIFKFSKSDMEKELLGIEGNVLFLISLILGIIYGKKIFVQHSTGIYEKIYNLIPLYIKSYIENKPIIIFFVIFPILILVIYKILMVIIGLINRLTFYPVLGSVEEGIRERSSFWKRIAGMIFQIPRGISYLLIAVFILNIISSYNPTPKLTNYLSASEPYNYINDKVISKINNSELAKSIPEILNNTFKVVIKKSDTNGEIVYYNGVTLEEGIKSNNEIDNYAKSIAKKGYTTKDKGKLLYTWVGSNIKYDYGKADRILTDNFSDKSGAITTFNTRKGICFDYACLYVAMCRANNIKVRIITGEGYNGESWVGHAWNQIYLQDENKWINVDPTFYVGGNYYNSARFLIDHRNAEIAGEW
jgi:hypothetical protein